MSLETARMAHFHALTPEAQRVPRTELERLCAAEGATKPPMPGLSANTESAFSEKPAQFAAEVADSPGAPLSARPRGSHSGTANTPMRFEGGPAGEALT